jgi:hypothetical protein
MGAGDDLMALGEAQALARILGGPVKIEDRDGRVQASDLWKGEPDIATPGVVEKHRAVLINGRLCRPYINHWTTEDGKPRIVFTGWQAAMAPARLHLTHQELDRGERVRDALGPFVVLEPHVKPTASPNKDWGFQNYALVVAALRDVTFLQLGTGVAPVLPGVRFVQTVDFRDACAVLSAAEGYLGPEGGLHHAAAALGVPAVVIFGGFISPETTGYPTHRNLTGRKTHEPCGRWAPCDGCREALDSITPEEAAREVASLWRRQFVASER